MALILGGLGARLVYIATELSPPLLALAAEQRASKQAFPARRGMILDRRGRVCAVTEQRPNVFVDPSLVRDVEELAEKLAPRINLSVEEVVQRIERRPNSRFEVLAESVDEVTAAAVREIGDPAVGLSEKSVRRYPLGASMSHLLGWVGRDGAGMEGIELFFDQHLRGHDGSRGSIADGRRRALGRASEPMNPPEDGGHIVLTIDGEIQRIVESAVAEAVDEVNAENGLGLVMNPNTGDVLAMGCWPTFDPNRAAEAPATVRRNRAVTDPVEPGSTFKLFVAAGALERGFVNTHEKIDCKNGRYYFGRRLVRDTRPCGLLNLRGIIAKSSNIGMGLIAERMQNGVLHETVRRFGFGDKTGIDFPGESGGLVHPLNKWGSMTTQSVAMGYEIMVTPIQLASAFSAIVNGGFKVAPRLIQQITDASGEVIQRDEENDSGRRIISKETAKFLLNEAMRAVVEEGGGHRAKSERYTVAGKTGTAKLISPDGTYADREYLGTFIGTAPATDPAIVVLVMIRRPDPTIAYYGGRVAAPAVRKIIDQTLAYLGVPADKGQTEERIATSYQP